MRDEVHLMPLQKAYLGVTHTRVNGQRHCRQERARAALSTGFEQLGFFGAGDRAADVIASGEHPNIRLDLSPNSIATEDRSKGSYLKIDSLWRSLLREPFLLICADFLGTDIDDKERTEFRQKVF